MGETTQAPESPESLLAKGFESVINQNNRENASNTPDFILAQYLVSCLVAFEQASNHRENWFGKHLDILDSQKDWPLENLGPAS